MSNEGLQNFCLKSTLMAFEQREIIIVSQLLWHGPSVFADSSEGLSHLVALYPPAWGLFLTISHRTISDDDPNISSKNNLKIC